MAVGFFSKVSRFRMSTLTIDAPKILSSPLVIPEKTMMGPGPTNVPERIRKAMALPTIGHLHPEFCKVCILRYSERITIHITLSMFYKHRSKWRTSQQN